MAKRTPSKTPPTRRARGKIADALDKHQRAGHDSPPDHTELKRAGSELSRAVEDSLNEEAVTEYLEDEKG
jgi:hypothetical protein